MESNKITAGTIARTIILIIALINQGLTVAGKSLLPIADEDVTQAVSLIFTIVTSLIAWWKNNSLTKEARQADVVLKQLKSLQVEDAADE